MIEVKPYETKLEKDGKPHTYITVCTTVRTEFQGVKQKHMVIYSGPDDGNAAMVRRDLGM